MAKNHPFFIYFFFCIQLQAHQDSVWTKEASTAYLQIQNLNPPSLLSSSSSNVNLYLDTYAKCTSLALNENLKLYDKQIDQIKNNIKSLSDQPKHSPYTRFFLADNKLQLAFLQVLFNDHWDAYWNFRSAYKLINTNIELYPSFIPHYKTAGVLNLIIGSIPEQYQWISNSLGFDGSIKQAEHYFSYIINSDSDFKTEATLYLSAAYVLIYGDYGKCFQHLNSISRNEQTNFYTFLKAYLKLKQGKPHESIVTLNKLHELNRLKTNFPYLNYLYAEAEMNQGHYQKSINHFKKYLAEYNGKNHLKSSQYKLFCNYFLLGDSTTAKSYFARISQVGQEVYNTDAYAQKQSLSPLWPNKELLTVRIYCDGGNWNKGFTVLQQLNPLLLSSSDRIEYEYRMGRYYQHQKQYKLALEHYTRVINYTSDDFFSYYTPNSALQIGYIYEELNAREQARTYYKKTLTYKHFEYQKSIHHKAKAALKHLDN